MAPALWWRGANIPNDIADTLARIGPLRGDEVFTEEIAMALASGNERCLVVALAARSIPAGPTPDTGDAPDTGPATFAVVIEDVRSEARRWTVETVAPGNLPSLHHDLLRAVANHHQCPSLLFWRPPTTPADEEFAVPAGSRRDRTILEMHTRLPLAPETGGSRPIPLVQYRAFCSIANVDASAFVDSVVAINNAAFADHPEQGALSHSVFALRTTAPWFDAHGLSIATVDGRDIGFVWMKCAPARPAELYVVAVDPTSSVPGLGRALVRHGFAHADRAHGATHAMLFVDAANERAMGLYRSLGFCAVRRQDVVQITTPESRPFMRSSQRGDHVSESRT